jgi:predicted ABC-type ATPase
MIVIVNGAFGVGKTTVVNLLRTRLRETAVFDPERIGYVLRRLPAFVPLSTKRLDDYQDSARWRSFTIWLAVRRSRRCRILLMPVCFSNVQYLQEIRSGLTARGLRVLHLCLTAAVETIELRLKEGGFDPDSEEGRWVYPRARRACALHAVPEFAVHVPTDGRDPDEVGNDICLHIARAG